MFYLFWFSNLFMGQPEVGTSLKALREIVAKFGLTTMQFTGVLSIRTHVIVRACCAVYYYLDKSCLNLHSKHSLKRFSSSYHSKSDAEVCLFFDLTKFCLIPHLLMQMKYHYVLHCHQLNQNLVQEKKNNI